MIEVTMETVEHLPREQRKFLAKYDRYEPLILDHTAIIAAKQCLRKYFYQIVLGRVTTEEAIYFAWGSAYHKFREVLERTYGFGENKPKTFDPEQAQEAFIEASQAGLAYWRKHGKDQDSESKFSWMTSARLLQSFAAAFKHWTLEKKQGVIEVVAVEQAFNVTLADGGHRSGRADQIVRWMAKLWGRDFKTSSKEGAWYARTLDPNEQFTGYTFAEAKLAGERVQGQIVEVLYNAKATKSGAKGPDIIEYTTSRTPWQLDNWEKDTIFYHEILKKAREEDRWPMSEVGCNFCPYYMVCKQGNESSMMYQLESNYKLRPWDNTKIGED